MRVPAHVANEGMGASGNGVRDGAPAPPLPSGAREVPGVITVMGWAHLGLRQGRVNTSEGIPSRLWKP
jgi:hypothetical protein